MIVALTEVQLEKVRTNIDTYKWAANAVSIPWEMLPAVHFRERNLDILPNPYQFDPASRWTSSWIHDLLMHYSSLHEADIVKLASAGINDFKTASLCAAAWLVKGCPMRLDMSHTADNVIKEAFYSYNGRAYGSANNSPYVMNGFDEKHYPMLIVGSVEDPHSPTKRKKISTEDRRPGAFVVYKQLQSLKL